MLLSFSASAQTFVRYAVSSDFGSKKLYSDKVLGSVVLPHGVSRVDGNPQMQAAAEELKTKFLSTEKWLKYLVFLIRITII